MNPFQRHMQPNPQFPQNTDPVLQAGNFPYGNLSRPTVNYQNNPLSNPVNQYFHNNHNPPRADNFNRNFWGCNQQVPEGPFPYPPFPPIRQEPPGVQGGFTPELFFGRRQGNGQPNLHLNYPPPGSFSGQCVNQPRTNFNATHGNRLPSARSQFPRSPYFNQRQPANISLPLHTHSQSSPSDSALVNNFLLQKGITKAFESKGQNDVGKKACKFLKICEAQDLIKRAKRLIVLLENDLTSANPKMEELSNILHVMQDKEVIDDLNFKITKRRKSRNRRKVVKQDIYRSSQLQKQRIEEKNAKIEKWQKLEKEKSNQQLREAEMQKQIDEALVEVRKEQHSLTKSVEMITSLAKLRKARLTTLKSKGGSVPSESATAIFNKAVLDIKSQLSLHRKSSDDKAASLKLFIEAEQQEARALIERKRKERVQETRLKWEGERSVVLFGEQREVDAFAPMWPVQEIHKQANLSLNNLIQYRIIWDQYLNKEGSSIPVDWVEPVKPSSSIWTELCDEQMHQKNH